MTFAAIVLAAGASSRFGGRPKSMLPVGDESAIHRIVRVAERAGCRPVVVVVGEHVEAISREVGGLAVRIAVNRQWAVGRTGSVQCGIRELGAGENVLLWPVDHPFVEAKTVDRLREALMTDRGGIWFIPTHEGKGGHPVALKPAAIQQVLELHPATALRALLPTLGPRVVRLPVDDPGIVANIDTPKEYDRYYREWQARRKELWTAD